MGGGWVVLRFKDGLCRSTTICTDQRAAVEAARAQRGYGSKYTAQIAGPLRTPEPDIGEAWDDTGGEG